MNREIVLYETQGTPCPYLPSRIWRTHLFFASSFSGAFYETLLAEGFRRSGTHFYRNRCPACDECRQLRIPVSRFVPSRSQLRILRKNRDVETGLEPAGFRRDVYDLYRRYGEYKHGKTEDSEDEFLRFLSESPLDTRMMLYKIGGRLAGVGWLDFLPASLSSVYFAFEPDFASRSLGTLSVLREIELARSLGKSSYYLGFHVEGSEKMRYKARFHPHERLLGSVWQEFP